MRDLHPGRLVELSRLRSLLSRDRLGFGAGRDLLAGRRRGSRSADVSASHRRLQLGPLRPGQQNRSRAAVTCLAQLAAWLTPGERPERPAIPMTYFGEL